MSGLRIDVVSLAPEAFAPLQGLGVIGRAFRAGIASLHTHNPRDFATDRYRKVDDEPYGGGAGMVLKPEPIFKAFEALKAEHPGEPLLTILLSPQGRLLDQQQAERLSGETRRIVLLCGHYEAIDERVRTALIDEELSIGDYVLTGGELAALVVIDAATRLLPGVLGDEESSYRDSFGDGLLDHPHYTRPADFRGMKVPDVLLGGNHAEIEKWRRQQALMATLTKRPDLLEAADLSDGDRKLLKELREKTS
jgi:tRNA (guanine-N1)-methyltransferase